MSRRHLQSIRTIFDRPHRHDAEAALNGESGEPGHAHIAYAGRHGDTFVPPRHVLVLPEARAGNGNDAQQDEEEQEDTEM